MIPWGVAGGNKNNYWNKIKQKCLDAEFHPFCPLKRENSKESIDLKESIC